MSRVGANLHFPKYFEKYARLAREEKYPEIYRTRDRICEMHACDVPVPAHGGLASDSAVSAPYDTTWAVDVMREKRWENRA